MDLAKAMYLTFTCTQAQLQIGTFLKTPHNVC